MRTLFSLLCVLPNKSFTNFAKKGFTSSTGLVYHSLCIPKNSSQLKKVIASTLYLYLFVRTCIIDMENGVKGQSEVTAIMVEATSKT